MPLPGQPTLLPLNVQFNGDTITITYVDPRHQSPRVRDTLTRDIDVRVIEEEVEDLISTIVDIIDRTDVERRKPPESIDRGSDD